MEDGVLFVSILTIDDFSMYEFILSAMNARVDVPDYIIIGNAHFDRSFFFLIDPSTMIPNSGNFHNTCVIIIL